MYKHYLPLLLQPVLGADHARYDACPAVTDIGPLRSLRRPALDASSGDIHTLPDTHGCTSDGRITVASVAVVVTACAQCRFVSHPVIVTCDLVIESRPDSDSNALCTLTIALTLEARKARDAVVYSILRLYTAGETILILVRQNN